MTVTVIVISLPKTVRFNYQYVQGLPWAYGELIAPFDFAILKTNEELTKEKNQVLEQLIPFYSYSRDITDSMQLILKNNFEDKWTVKYQNSEQLLKERTFGVVQQLFKNVSSKGILSSKEIVPDKQYINILTGNNANRVSLKKVYTLQTAQLYYQSEIENRDTIDKSLALDVLQNSLFINLSYNHETTVNEEKRLLSQLSLTRGLVQKGERILSKGELVSAAKFQILFSLENEFNKQFGGSKKFKNILFGQSLLVLFSIGLLIVFIWYFSPEILTDSRKVMLILSSILIVVIPLSILIQTANEYVLLFPLALLPLVLRSFFEEKLSLTIHLITVLIMSAFVPRGFQFVFLQIIVGIVAVVGVKNLHKRGQVFITSLLIFLSYVLVYFILLLVMDGGLAKFSIFTVFLFAISSILTLFSFPLIYFFEKLFSQLTNISLLELSDMNSSLLRDLARKAPGTFQHCIQVGNMSEAVIQEIGGNPLLVRAGALYHDIGKTYNPRYFIENQITGLNPHDELSYEESVSLIKGHVALGIQLAKKHNIPDPIIDFIRTHHGNRRVEYFYRNAVKDLGEKAVYEEDYTYNGPIPFSRETAVLMMADSVEAASRSITRPDEDNIGQLVDTIIDEQIKANQFINSDITFRDISTTKKIFKRFLLNIYHIRIEYPK
ncbi:MAG: HDIG domain-containing protein [Bacteroidales bacterium]|nr:HDIG domain-containing protein [Bacteroidales bacterium]